MSSRTTLEINRLPKLRPGLVILFNHQQSKFKLAKQT